MDSVVLSKVKSIERCVNRVKEEFNASDNFGEDYSRQDAAILNLQRACELSIDIANYLVKKRKLGLIHRSREAFILLRDEKIIDKELCEKLVKMVGFRNLAVHDYQELNPAILISIINKEIDVFSEFNRCLLDIDN